MTTDPSRPFGDAPSVLDFNGHSIAVCLFDGVPFFAIDDLCRALRWNAYPAEKARNASFPVHAKRIAEEDTDSGPREVLCLSPLGVYLWTERTDAARGQRVAAWAKREAARMCPNASPGDPRFFLTPTPEGHLPPKPLKYSGRLAEWFALKDAGYPSAQDALKAAREDEWRRMVASNASGVSPSGRGE